jgi:hypothetical protein
VTDSLVGVAEIAALLRVSKQRVDELSHLPGFPRPVGRLAAGRVWLLSDVTLWDRERRKAHLKISTSVESPRKGA